MKRFALLIVFILVSSVLSRYKTKSVINSSEIIGDLVRLNVNKINMPLLNEGSIGKYGSTWYPNGQTSLSFLFEGGFGVTGYVNGELRASFMARSSLIREWQAGKYGMDPANSSARFYQVGVWDTLGSYAYINWTDAVELGADFIDLDHDGLYNPNVDKPPVLGEKNIWTVFNDGTSMAKRYPRLGTKPLGLEIFQTAWAYHDNGPFDDVIFFWFRLINTTDTTIQEAYFSVWQDPDIGGASDDLMGYDSLTQLAYCYNDNFDEDGYGAFPPAFGVKLLQGVVVDSPGDTAFVFRGLGSGVDTLINKRSREWNSYTQTIGGSAILADPATAQIVRNYQIGGLDMNGNPIIPTQWGTGATASTNPNFFYSGDPITGTGWIDITPDDKRTFTSMGPFHLAPADTQDIIFAYIAGQGTNSLNSVELMRNRTQVVSGFFPNGQFLDISVKDTLISVDSTFNFKANLYSLSGGEQLNCVTWQIIQKPTGSNVQIIPGSGLVTTLIPDLPGRYFIQCESVTTSGAVLFDTVNVRAVGNYAPTANLIILPNNIIFGEDAVADASSSWDPDGDQIHFLWSYPGWLNVTTHDTSVLQFTPPHVGKDEIQVTVSDSFFQDTSLDTFIVHPLNHGFELKDSLVIPSQIREIEYRDGKLFLGTSSRDLFIIDANHPMSILSTHPVNGEYFILHNDTLIVYRRTVGVEIYLIGPGNQLTHQSTISANVSNGVFLKMPYLLIPTNNNSDFAVYNVSDLTSPYQEYVYDLPTGVTDIIFSGLLGIYYSKYPTIGMVSIDISDPLNIVELDSLILPIHGRKLEFNGNQIIALNGVYEGSEIEIFDASQPANLQQVGAFSISSNILGNNNLPIIDLTGDGIRLITGMVDGLKVYDISSPLSPEEKIFYHNGYRVQSSTVNVTDVYSGFINESGSLSWLYRLEMDTTLVEIAEEPGSVIEEVHLFQNYPNPFNAGTTIRYQLQERSMVKLVVYNLLGQRVKSLVQGQQSAGKYSIHWDGTSDAGRPVASGIYIYRITVDNYVQSRKMMLLK